MFPAFNYPNERRDGVGIEEENQGSQKKKKRGKKNNQITLKRESELLLNSH